MFHGWKTKFVGVGSLLAMCLFLESQPLWSASKKKPTKPIEKTKSGLERKVQAPKRSKPEVKNSKKAKKAKKTVKVSELSKKLRGKLVASSGVGFFSIKKNGDNWRGSGSSDIRLSYQMPQKILDKELWSTLRYLPVDVAPLQTVDAGEAQMNGVVHFALAGAYLVFPSGKFDINGSFELGFGMVDAKAASAESDLKTKELDGGALAVVGAEAAWPITSNFSVAPALRLGFGAFQTTQAQVSAHLRF